MVLIVSTIKCNTLSSSYNMLEQPNSLDPSEEVDLLLDNGEDPLRHEPHVAYVVVCVVTFYPEAHLENKGMPLIGIIILPLLVKDLK